VFYTVFLLLFLTEYCPEVDRILKMPSDWQFELAKYASLEEAMCAPFDQPDPGRRWREGLTKSSFNYLLLDPRISQNLPRQLTCFNKGDIPLEAWKTFLSAIFYIGKGKRSRPYAHLYQAVRVWGKDPVCHKSGPKVKASYPFFFLNMVLGSGNFEDCVVYLLNLRFSNVIVWAPKSYKSKFGFASGGTYPRHLAIGPRRRLLARLPKHHSRGSVHQGGRHDRSHRH